MFPKLLQEASLQGIKDAILHHFKPVNFEASERAKFNMLSRSPFRVHPQLRTSVAETSGQVQFRGRTRQPHRDRLIAGINDAALQKKMLLEERQTFSSLRTLCEKFEELDKAVEQPAACDSSEVARA